jgi:hypothetical protein
VATHDLDRGSPHTHAASDQPAQRLVGTTVDGRGDEADDDRAVALADHLVPAGAGLDADPHHSGTLP